MTSTEQHDIDEGSIDTSCALLEFRPNDLILITSKPIVHDLAGAREVVDIVKGIHARRGRKLRLLIDMRPVRSLSRDARLLYQSEEYAASLIGAALMVDSGISRVIGNFVMRLNVGPAPTRLFTSADAAKAWLESLQDE